MVTAGVLHHLAGLLARILSRLQTPLPLKERLLLLLAEVIRY